MKKTAILICFVMIFALATLCLVACDVETYTLSTATNLEGAGIFTQLDGEEISAGNSVTLTSRTYEGYTWLGWYEGDTLVSQDKSWTFKMPSRDITYTAKWEIEQYYIGYNYFDGRYVFRSQPYQVTSPRIMLDIPNVKGFVFEGWYNNSDCLGTPITYVDTGSIGNKTFFGKMTLVDYTINYHLDGGVNPIENPTQYNILGQDVVLLDATKEGYSFDGWYLDESFTRRADEFDKNWCQNVDLYAHFYPFESTIDENDNVTIVSYCGTGSEVEIPETINGKKVVKINRGLLAQCENITDLTIPFVGEYENPPSIPLEGGGWRHELQIFGLLFGGDNYETQNDYVPNTLKNVKVTAGNSIAWCAFFGCKNLTSITLSATTSFIYSKAVAGCESLQSLKVDKNSSYFYSKGNCIISKSDHSIVSGCVASTIPQDRHINTIRGYAFAGCVGLSSITIPDNIKNIGFEAFNNCTDLVEVIGCNNVVELGIDCFDNTPWFDNQSDGIVYLGKTVYKYKGTMPNDTSIVIKDGIETIGTYAFRYCKGLNSVSLPDSLKTIMRFAFYRCENLTNVTFPDNLTRIGAFAFGYCESLTSVKIPANVIEVGSDVAYDIGSSNPFVGCSNLNSIVVDENNEKYHSEGNCLIETATNTLVVGSIASVIPSDGSVTSINEMAFASLKGLTSIVIPNSITKIGYEAFADCSGLTEIVIPSSVDVIERNVLKGCSNLTSIVVNKNNKKYNSSGNCLIETESKTLIAGCKNTVIPTDGSVTRIGDYAFWYVKLEEATIPNTITYIGDSALFYIFSKLPVLTFLGTMEEWNAIEKENNYPAYTIICTDGTIEGSTNSTT